jgi:iron complex outermembrane receptor protein
VQGDVSLLGASACRGESRARVRGRFAVDEALRRILSGSHCGWRMVDARTVQITVAPPPRPKSSPTTPAGPSEAPTVAELRITAGKRIANLDQLAVAISVVGQGDLRAHLVDDAGGALGLVAGLQMTNLGPGRDKLMLRGLSDGAFTGRARSTVGTYLDSVPINYNAPDPDLRLADIEQVEVARGPQGALYGAGALSGVYRIVTRKPDLQAWDGGVLAYGGATKGGSPSGALEAYLNAPLLPGYLGVRATAYQERQGGYLDDLDMRRSNVDSTVRKGARLAIRAEPDARWTFDLSAVVQHLRSNDTQYTTLTPMAVRRRANRVAESHQNDFSEAALAVRGDLGWGELSWTVGRVRHVYLSQFDASAALDLFSDATPDLGVYVESTRNHMWVQDLYLASPAGRRFGWLGGVYASSTREVYEPVLLARRVAAPLELIYSEARRDRQRELAAYGELSYEVTPGWTVAVGGRAFQTRLHTASDIVSPTPAGQSRQVVRGERFQGVSPKVSLAWTPAPGTLVYASVSEGYRPGGVNTAGLTPLRVRRATFSPDRLRNWEIGGRYRSADGRLSAQGAGFYDQWRNVQADQYLPSGLAYTANVGDARLIGVEAELAYDWAFGLQAKGNLLLRRARFVDANPDFAARLAPGLPGAASVVGSVSLGYRRPLSSRLTMRLLAEATYLGPSRVGFDPAISPKFGSYVRSRLSAGVTSERWSADVFVSNPTNDEGDTFAYGNPFSFGQVRQITPQRPRTIGLVVGANF